MTQDIGSIWVYLSASPLLGLTITLLAYQGAFWIYQRTGHNPLANPVLIAVAALVLFLSLTGTSYDTYFAGAQFVHFLLGPATVALAIPLYTQFRRVRSMLLPVLAGLLAGSLTAIVSAVLVARLLGASSATQLSLAPKSVTTPIAIGIASHGIGTARAFQVSEQSGAFAALAMGMNGALTALLVPWLVVSI
jgi:putative effector of murein hydrolase